ncbi:MAG TPA: DUF3093 domain-containing protein [Pseudonocardiaceae bacterium]|nr:DUF3093 domain-containing protein [Pseudonocardiaceae bacterium]
MTDSASTAATGTEASATDAPAAGPNYSERLYLPWWHWLLPLLAAGLLAAEVHMGYPGVRAWLPYVITIPLCLLILWRFSAAKVEVHDGEIFVGEAHLPVKFIEEIRIVPATAKRKVLGPNFDPAAFALHRSWVGPMVFLKLDDPDDPTPYWLISSRTPEHLVNAITAAIALETDSTNDDSTGDGSTNAGRTPEKPAEEV